MTAPLVGLVDCIPHWAENGVRIFRRRPPVPQLPTSPMKQKEIIDRQQQQRIQTFRFFPKLLFIPLSQLAYVSHCLALLLFIAFNSYLPFKNKNTN